MRGGGVVGCELGGCDASGMRASGFFSGGVSSGVGRGAFPRFANIPLDGSARPPLAGLPIGRVSRTGLLAAHRPLHRATHVLAVQPSACRVRRSSTLGTTVAMSMLSTLKAAEVQRRGEAFWLGWPSQKARVWA